MFLVKRKSFALIVRTGWSIDVRTLIPVHTDPAEGVGDAGDAVFFVASLVGVLDPEDELATVLTGIEPGEQGCPDTANVQIAGRAGGESDTNRAVGVVGGSHQVSFIWPSCCGICAVDAGDIADTGSSACQSSMRVACGLMMEIQDGKLGGCVLASDL